MWKAKVTNNMHGEADNDDDSSARKRLIAMASSAVYTTDGVLATAASGMPSYLQIALALRRLDGAEGCWRHR